MAGIVGPRPLSPRTPPSPSDCDGGSELERDLEAAISEIAPAHRGPHRVGQPAHQGESRRGAQPAPGDADGRHQYARQRRARHLPQPDAGAELVAVRNNSLKREKSPKSVSRRLASWPSGSPPPFGFMLVQKMLWSTWLEP